MLAQFPPLLMQCGEKDPFVDDTVIFAGRVREAKRARRAELDLVLSGKSARFGEGLRMSAKDSGGGVDGAKMSALRKERERLGREGEEDWVQMVLFSEWSHGYLQMQSLMQEAGAVVAELAEWMNDAFVRYGEEEDRERSAKGECGDGVVTEASETEDESSSVITFVARRHGTPEAVEKGGKTITETELIRRRRMLF
jgi:hypothetical protein